MNNGTFVFAGNDIQRQLDARREKEAAEKAARQAESANNNNATKNTANDEFLKEFARQTIKDLSFALMNPVLGSVKFNKDLGDTLARSIVGTSSTSKKPEKTLDEYTDEEKMEALKFIEDEKRKVKDAFSVTKSADETPTNVEDEGEYVEYTYKPGDTFGQVVVDLGLESGNGLWGDNGDVNYYTQQLIDQGLWNDGIAGNIPIGTTIRLKKRPLTQEMLDYRNQYGY